MPLKKMLVSFSHHIFFVTFSVSVAYQDNVKSRLVTGFVSKTPKQIFVCYRINLKSCNFLHSLPRGMTYAQVRLICNQKKKKSFMCSLFSDQEPLEGTVGVGVFATDSSTEEVEAPGSVDLFQNDTDDEDFNRFSDLK